jgi:transcriptional regulator with XRE-family HTH domain
MKPAEKYESDLLSGLLSEITPEEQEKTNKRMILAAKIDKARLKKGWSKKELADRMGKRPSEITKWLSGTHNFTTDTLFDLEYKLESRFFNMGEKPKEQVIHFHLSLSQMVNTDNCTEAVNQIKTPKTYAAWAGNNSGSC